MSSSKKQHPEIQASINGAEPACIFAANSGGCINTGLVLAALQGLYCVFDSLLAAAKFISESVGSVYESHYYSQE